MNIKKYKYVICVFPKKMISFIFFSLLNMFHYISQIEEKYGIDFSEYDQYHNDILNIFNLNKLKLNEYDLNNSNILYIIGLYYYRRNINYNKAKYYFSLAINRGNNDSTDYIISIYTQMNDYNNAEKYSLKYFIVDDPYKNMCLGLLYFEMQKYNNAEKYLLYAIQYYNGDNTYPEIYEKLAIIYELNSDFINAIKYYSLYFNKNKIETSHKLSKLYCKLNKFEEANKYYQIIIEHGQKNFSLYLELAMFYQNYNIYCADYYYLLAIKHCPNDYSIGNIYFDLATVYFKTQSYYESEKYFKLACAHNIPSVFEYLGIICLKLNDYLKAEEYFLIQINNNPTDTSYHNLGLAYLGQQNKELAKKYFLMSIELHKLNSFIELKSIFNNDLKLYIYFDNIKNKNLFINENISLLMKNKKVLIYKNKLSYSIEKNNTDYCPICFDTKISIMLNCGHTICFECFPNLDDKCYYCREHFI